MDSIHYSENIYKDIYPFVAYVPKENEYTIFYRWKKHIAL